MARKRVCITTRSVGVGFRVGELGKVNNMYVPRFYPNYWSDSSTFHWYYNYPRTQCGRLWPKPAVQYQVSMMYVCMYVRTAEPFFFLLSFRVRTKKEKILRRIRLMLLRPKWQRGFAWVRARKYHWCMICLIIKNVINTFNLSKTRGAYYIWVRSK